MDAETTPSAELLERDLDAIISELDASFGELPVEAIRAAEAYRDRSELVPRLEQVIERAVQRLEDGEKVETNGHFFALFLLVEFCAVESFARTSNTLPVLSPSMPENVSFVAVGASFTGFTVIVTVPVREDPALSRAV